MKYYIIAGEASGDWHGSLLMKEILSVDKNAQFRFWGGDLMLKFNNNIAKHYKETAFMGLWEVFVNLKTISNNLKFCKQDILNFNPDAVIFIDYPGFNLKIAKFTFLKGFKNFYYISPKLWAWKKGRIKQVKLYIHRMLCIFPFEKDFYAQNSFDAEYVGNPTAFFISEILKKEFDPKEFIHNNNLSQKPIIALLPGSRKQEIKKMLPIYSQIANEFKEYEFVVAAMKAVDNSLYDTNANLHFVFDQTYELLRIAKAAVVTSGTATLETALFGVPQIVCYRTSFITYIVGSIVLTKIKFISLVNIIMNKKVVEEVIQRKMKQRIEKELQEILENKKHYIEIKNNYQQLNEKLNSGNAPLNASKIIHEYLLKG